MKRIIKSNAWFLALSICSFTFLGFKALETSSLIRINLTQWIIEIDGRKISEEDKK